jgi:AraC family transcriptional activator of pobA
MKTPIKPLLVFNRVQDLYSAMDIAIETLDPKSEFSIYNLGDLGLPATYQSPVFRAGFFSFLFIKEAWGHYSSDALQFDYKPHTVYFNNPGHIKQFTIRQAKNLFLLTLSESFLKENVHADIFDEFPFLLCEIVPPQDLKPKEFAEFEALYLQIQKAYHSGSAYRHKLIGHLFVAILLKLKENLSPDCSPVRHSGRASEIVKKFKLSIEKHYRDLSDGVIEKAHRVQEYADLLNLHPNYLNAVIKAKTGKSIGNWIAEKTIAEAKSLLKNSDIPVKEISYRLGFAEIQHFSTYFKKHTQSSPVVYRQGA